MSVSTVTMEILCAWCGKSLGWKVFRADPALYPKHPLSHGICPECSDKHFGERLERGSAA